jgi:Family of unknown function (DUF5330)
MFLVRSAFWLSVVILLLPAEIDETDTKLGNAQTSITAGQALGAAKSTVSDLSGFCLRNQIACSTGKAAVDIFIRKAQYGANLLNEWVSGVSSANASTVKPVDHSSLHAPVGRKRIAGAQKTGGSVHKTKSAHASQQTLTKEDLRPAWEGLKTKRKA